MRPLALVILTATLVVTPSTAQTSQDEDGPGRGVARLSVLNGEVSIRRGDSGELVAAAVNAPLVVQDRVLTGPSSRVELQFDHANMIRMGANGEIRLSELEYRRYQIQIALGTTTFRVLRNSDAQVELSTPSVAVRPLKRGEYRITVREDGAAEITVRSGEVEIYTPQGTERLKSGRTMLARGTASNPEFQVISAIPQDDWDRWNDNRDRDLERSTSYTYVSNDIYGAEDLDSYGSWVDVPTYGRVWRPVVVGDWAPYRHGRWSWVDYYGWTWVSYDPWGWAPYHYGRWFNSPGFGWCWWPGSGRSYWRPALVAFFGFGGYNGFNAGFGFGYGRVGWVPLAPYEPFHPWYGRGYYGGFRNNTYVNNTTIVNNTNIVNVYRNARITNAITAVNSDRFGRTHVDGRNHVRVTDAEIQRAGLVRGQMPLTPDRESLRVADRQVRVSDLPRTAENRSFFSTRQATRVDRVPFEQQRQGIESVARRTFSDTSGRGDSAAGRGSESSFSGRGADNGDSGRGWRRVGDSGAVTGDSGRGSDNPGRGAVRTDSGRGASTDSGDGWRRFGDSGGRGTSVDAGRSGAGRVDSGRGSAPAAQPDNSDGNWRRFGDGGSRGSGRIDSGRGSSPAAQPDNSGGNWRRFGEPGGSRGSDSTPDRSGGSGRIDSGRGSSPAAQPDSGGSWRRFGEPGGSRSEGRATSDSGRGSRSEPMQISPPIVRERSAEPRYERQQPSFGRPSRSESPRFESPSPRMERSAPRFESPRAEPRGGGGGARESGGGGSRGGDAGGGRSGGDRGGRGR